MKQDKLRQSAASIDKFFTAAQPEPAKDPTPAKKQRKIDTHKTFSFWARKDLADRWRAWAEAKGMKLDDLGEKAITEYVNAHPLSDDEQIIYDMRIAIKHRENLRKAAGGKGQ